MLSHKILMPSQPEILEEKGNKGVYRIDGLYPGYGQTLGNSLRRVSLSSIPGAAIVSVKIDGVQHEFSVMDGVKEDVLTIILNLKRVVFKLESEESQEIVLKVKGPGTYKAGKIETPSQVKVVNPESHILTATDKKVDFTIHMVVAKGLGYVSKKDLSSGKLSAGTIVMDASFAPTRRVFYQVDNMRVGDRTDFNRLTFSIETDGTITPKEVLETSIETMIKQMQAIIGFKKEVVFTEEKKKDKISGDKVSLVNLNLNTRTFNALESAKIRIAGELATKNEEEILNLEGLGQKGLEEIKVVLSKLGLSLKASSGKD